MGIVRGHGEEDVRYQHGVFATGDGEMGKEATVWDLVAGRGNIVLKVEGMQDVRTYIGRRQAMVAQLVSFWTIL